MQLLLHGLLEKGGILFLEDASLAFLDRNDVKPEKGDVLCMVKGTWDPLILRPEGFSYTMIGFCFWNSHGLRNPEESFYQKGALERFEVV
jgi:hypothetical protein